MLGVTGHSDMFSLHESHMPKLHSWQMMLWFGIQVSVLSTGQLGRWTSVLLWLPQAVLCMLCLYGMTTPAPACCVPSGLLIQNSMYAQLRHFIIFAMVLVLTSCQFNAVGVH